MSSNPDIAISVRNLGKCYRIYDRPQDRLKQSLWRHRQYFREFWALKDVSFDVKKGETVGIIGRNGSGKSTLLQIIAGTLTPTAGRVQTNGRVAALLELGSGFNPEFTGRENVYMNGAILGLSRKEIEEQFDAIAAFADIGDFIDQPVRMYSSGMYVRLAFAVAINVKPDILIVDESLAVGDEAFQRKCFSRIHSMQEMGGTIIFVSHAASSIIELCNRAMLIEGGERLLTGSPKPVVSHYHKLLYAPPENRESIRHGLRAFNNQSQGGASESRVIFMSKQATLREQRSCEYYDEGMIPKSTISYESRGARIEDPHITTFDGKRVNILDKGEKYFYTYSVHFSAPAFSVGFGMLIKTVSGFEIGGATTSIGDRVIDYISPAQSTHVQFLFRCLLQPGVYFVNAGTSAILNGERAFLHRIVDAAMFRVQEGEDHTLTGVVDLCIEPLITLQAHTTNDT